MSRRHGARIEPASKKVALADLAESMRAERSTRSRMLDSGPQAASVNAWLLAVMAGVAIQAVAARGLPRGLLGVCRRYAGTAAELHVERASVMQAASFHSTDAVTSSGVRHDRRRQPNTRHDASCDRWRIFAMRGSSADGVGLKTTASCAATTARSLILRDAPKSKARRKVVDEVLARAPFRIAGIPSHQPHLGLGPFPHYLRSISVP
ncbi:MAG: hypothetical protein H6871_10750 [Methylobacteriaceae bacterium]|nr:hypothetical protein [Methylobacteriaceae bacterium]